ncbi:MAG: hypothetical protein PWQ41_1605 [Bacillota bacterium]|nr:hypothetical protein [Bacillota bacterium]MDK2855641.1 hypothetical protein [Bacillota bacterium]MDK2925831.1 hypothetical protein [Bacillota bacterium]
MQRKRYFRDASFGALALTLVLLVLALTLTRLPRLVPAFAAKSDALSRAEELLKLRSDLLVKGNPEELARFYLPMESRARWALEKEAARIHYLREWAPMRRIEFTRAKIDFTRVSVEAGEKEAGVSISAHTLLSYRHLDRPEAGESTLGWRTVHWIELTREGREWLVRAEWYLDPLEAASRNPTVAAAGGELKGYGQEYGSAQGDPVTNRGAYRREAAVRYADRYAGVKVGPGTGRYNQKYRDFTGLGGDCANFVSQALADEEAGSLPQDWNWCYVDGEGSEAWLKAEALVYHLLGTGRAVSLARGSLAEVVAAREGNTASALAALRPGDIIAYEEGGEIQHVSLVVGWDEAGYILVNSHSADRYHVPWDLGYGAETRYWLLAVQG